ncbi:MAG: hypothetical protein N4A63_13140 [Vallitalea sp.]|jgi:hypothetical protein|nr:hypothetical protein [Vallitalea sp.]
MPYESIKKIGWFLGALLGIAIRFSIILLYWYLMKVKYIKEDKKIGKAKEKYGDKYKP